jgi:hypothetical protein
MLTISAADRLSLNGVLSFVFGLRPELTGNAVFLMRPDDDVLIVFINISRWDM